MVSLRILFGLVPKTAEYETAMDALKKEYLEFVSFNESKELAEYLDLEKTIVSSDFALKKRQIQQQKYADTPEYRQEKEFNSLRKSKQIRQYYAVKNSAELKEYKATEVSDQLARYYQLEKFIQSPEFLEVKRFMAQPAKEKFKVSELYKTFAQYHELLRSYRVTTYYKMLKSKYYPDYKALLNTGRLVDFELLKKIVNSTDFEVKRTSMGKKEFKKTEDYAKLVAYKKLKISRDIKHYIAFTNLPGYSLFTELDGSKEIINFEKIQKEVTSPDFDREKKKIENQRFENTSEYKKQVEFELLKKSDKIRGYFSFDKSKLYENFKRLDGSDTIAHYEELEKTLASGAFRKVKEYMLLPGKKKFELSDEFKMEQEYYKLKSSDKFKWYFKVKDSRKYDEVKRWNITFTEDFSTGIDRKKWITRYFWGEAILKDTYALSDEKHLFTDGKNLEVAHGKLKIITRKEKIQGKAWNPSMGFYPKEFNYTSGLISTGAGFRQQYGLFEAKIRLNRSYPVNHAFWMVSEHMLPHIDVVKCAKKMSFGNYWSLDGNKAGKNRASTGVGKYTTDFFIYSLEWSQQKLVWKINGIPVITSTIGVPDLPMYINFNSGLYTEADNSVLPASMEIDWIRCYQHVG
jgi:beta-glucanase (GH16 family)